MKVLFSAIVFLLNSFCAKSQTAETWYKVYTGKVGNLSGTLHLHKAGKTYAGYIWFDQNERPMTLYSSQQVAVTDSINISSVSGSITLNLTGIFNNESFTGISVLEKEGSSSKRATFQLNISTSKNFTSFDYFYAEDSAKLLPQIKNESSSDYISATIWPKENSIIDVALRKQISKSLRMPATVTEPGKWLISETKKSATVWKKENSKLSPKEASEMGLSLSVQEENRVMIMYENEYYITLADYSYAYTGGAHGNYGTSLISINKQSSKQMQLANVLNAEGIKMLPAYLDKVARVQYGIKNNQPLDQNNFLVKKIEPSKNFYITTSGIGFLYAPYEIKSFADGDINLLVPFTALKSYLQADFKY